MRSIIFPRIKFGASWMSSMPGPRRTELAPIFYRAIPGDWGPHLATMRDFGRQ